MVYACYRSVTLVGEKERKLLKEIVKQARSPVKNRIISQGMHSYQLMICRLDFIRWIGCINYTNNVKVHLYLWSCITEIINKYKIKISKHEEDINTILKQEKEEKEVRDDLKVCCVLQRVML